MRWAPPGFGGSPEEVKREGWRDTGVLVVCTQDERLIWPERELAGEKFYEGRVHVTEWTTNIVEDQLLEAADVLTRLPDVRVHGYYGLWPKMILQFSDLVGQEPPKLRRPPPSPEAITRMEQAMPWLTWLEPQDAKLVWARAERSPWKLICWRFGFSRATANRRWEYGLSTIAWRLNGRPALRKRSQRFVIERMREVSRL